MHVPVTNASVISICSLRKKYKNSLSTFAIILLRLLQFKITCQQFSAAVSQHRDDTMRKDEVSKRKEKGRDGKGLKMGLVVPVCNER